MKFYGKLFMLKVLLLILMTNHVWAQSELDKLYNEFRNPPKEYTAVPFWSWNGTLDPEKISWQVEEMADKGIYGAFMHARAGIDYSETPYFSEGWWKAVEATIETSKKAGFFPYLYDEDKWPSGSAGGRTLAADSLANSKKALRYRTIKVEGPKTVNLDFSGNVKAVIAIQPLSDGNIDPETLTDLTDNLGKSWEVRRGKWELWIFTQHIEEDGVNYLRKQTVRTFMDITHEEYYRRFGKYFGSLIPGLFFDEISAGPHQSDLVWTDNFFQQFKKMKRYDLRPNLPVIFRNAGKITPKIRCDYYDVFTKLYVDSWFKQIAEWCSERGIYYTGHTYEDVNSYMSQGDYFRTWEPMQVPGTDNEDFRYTFPRKIGWFKPKQIASVAHTTGKKRIMGEILGGAGWGVTLEELRYGVGMLGVYGLNLFVPHLFHYSMDSPQSMDDWPNSWFYRNPYWKYFKTFADYMRRVSFMGSQGKHVCDIAILSPITSQWASGVTAVHDNLDPGGGYFGGKLQNDYMMMQEILLRNNWDFDVVHPEYFAKSIIEEKKFHAGDGSYNILLLPPLTAIRYSVLRKLEEFFLQGGIIIAIGQLPTDSWEGGKNDPEVLKVMRKIFQVNPSTIRSGYDETMPDFSTDYIINFYPDPFVSYDTEEKSTGVAYFTKKILSVPDIVDTHNTPSDICVLEGDKDSFKYLHRKAGEVDIYNVMNSSKRKCSWVITFRATGKPEIWNPVSGEREAYYNYIPIGENRTKMKLDLQPWENIYVVFSPRKKEIVLPSSLIHKTNLKDAKVVKVESEKVFVNGWVSSKEEQWSISGETGTQYFSGKGCVNNIPAEQLVEGPWKFLMTPKDLDYRWAIDVTEQIVELPVMSFRIEKEMEKSENWRRAENIKDTGGWKKVKLLDSLHPDEGCSRYASLWDAHWVTYYDYRQFPGDMGFGEGKTLYFRKKFKIENQPAKGRINIAADGLYTVYLNGNVLGKGKEWSSAKFIDLTSSLKQGMNLLEVVIKMDKKIVPSDIYIDDSQGSLLLQGEIHSGLGKLIRIFSDESCEVSRDSINWFPAFKLVYPPLGRYGDPWLRGKKITYPVTLWYRQVLPSGSVKILSPDIGGKYELYINGKVIPGPYSWPLSIKEWCGRNMNVIAIKVIANSGSDGIRKPLKFVVKPTKKTLQDWSSMGIGWYSGKGMYSTRFTLPRDFVNQNRRWMLDLGKVNFFAEVWINGKLVETKLWPPFIVNVTQYLRTGENKLDIVVSNLIANEMRWNIFDDAITWTRSRWWHDGSIIRETEKLVSGLLGPVRLIPYQKVEVTAPFQNSINTTY